MTAVAARSSLVPPLEQRRQVEAALRPQTVAPYLAAALDLPHPQRRQGSSGACHVLDVKYEPGAYCTILYRLNAQLVIGTIHWIGTETQLPAQARVVAPLNMHVYRFEDDPALPGLPTVMDPSAMASALRPILPDIAFPTARLLRCRITPLRYRPGKRCTVRLDLWLRDGPSGTISLETLYGKVYHEYGKAASVFAEMQLLSDAAPVQQGRLVVAHAAAFLPELLLVLQRPVEGTPLDAFLGAATSPIAVGDPRGWNGVVRAAEALAALHTAGLTSTSERSIAAETRRFGKRAAQVAAVAPALGAQMHALAGALTATLGQLAAWGEESSLIHGDCKPSQFLLSAAQVALLDFDHCGLADPASDVGNFMATLRQLAIRQGLKARAVPQAALARTRWLRALEQEFLDRYSASSGRNELFRLRTTWYESAALLRKALRAFGRSPHSNLPAALVEEAWACLAALPSTE